MRLVEKLYLNVTGYFPKCSIRPSNIPSSPFTDNPPQRGLHSKRSLCFRDPFISRRELRTSIVDSALKSALAVTIQSSRVIKSAGNVSNRVM